MSKSPVQKPAGPASGEDAVKAFISELQNAPAGEHAFFGMVKPAETAEGLMIAHAGDCETWAYIPASAIHAVKAEGNVRCKGHTHTMATLHLKAPKTELEQAFASVVSLHQTRLFHMSAALTRGGGCPPHCPDGYTCGPDSYGNLGCQPGPP